MVEGHKPYTPGLWLGPSGGLYPLAGPLTFLITIRWPWRGVQALTPHHWVAPTGTKCNAWGMEDVCFLCDSAAKNTYLGQTKMWECECSACKQFEIYAPLLEEMRKSQHWPQTRTRLALALQKGVVNNRVLKTERDIMDAIGGLSKPKE